MAAFQNLISLMTALSLELNNECFDFWELFVSICICQYAMDSKVEITRQCNNGPTARIAESCSAECVGPNDDIYSKYQFSIYSSLVNQCWLKLQYG